MLHRLVQTLPGQLQQQSILIQMVDTSCSLSLMSDNWAWSLQDLKEIGQQYVQDMRLKVPPSRSNATYVVDKMLRNAWNVGYISMLLPQACIIQVPHAH